MQSRALVALMLCGSLLLSGCAAFRSYESELTQTNLHLQSGDIDAAIALLEKNNGGENKDLLYYFEKGELLRSKGDLQGSLDAWAQADRQVFEWEEAVRGDPAKYLGEFGSVLVNDRVRRYEGYDYEKVMLTTQMAINHLALGNFEAARIEIKKTHEREALIAELRDREYLKREEEAEKQGITAELKDLQGYPVESLNAPEVISLKNSYQSAFSHYLSGFVYEALGERGMAAPGYRKAAELRPDTPLLEQALLDLDNPGARGDDESDVLLVLQTGLAPARDSVRIPLPIPTSNGLIITPLSFPVIKDDTSTAVLDSLALNGEALSLTELNSTEAMSRRALRDDMPGIILRTSVRAATRSVAQKQLNDVNPLAGLALGIASAITEGADERTWRTLPDSTRIVRLRLKKGEHQLQLLGAQVRLKIEQDYQVVPLRLVGNQVFTSGNAANLIPLAPLPTVAQANSL
ncbi:COG3014 family protein [Pseudomonas sp. PL-6]